MNVLMVPLDNRSVTYSFPKLVASIAGVNTILPGRSCWDLLTAPANSDALFRWIDSTFDINKFDAIFACADTMIYGGLINSRRTNERFESLKAGLARMSKWKKRTTGAHISVQSSIMRISDNHDATEEKEYWSQYGREIFAWSIDLHKFFNEASTSSSSVPGSTSAAVLNQSMHENGSLIPENIRKDYLSSRFRNYQINCALLNYLSNGNFDRLVLSLDDSGEYGLNVLEQEKLLLKIKRLNLNEQAVSYAGADEVLCTMFAHWLATNRAKHSESPTAIIKYSLPATQFVISRYEGQSIGNSLRSQASACGIRWIELDAANHSNVDFTIVVHGSESVQGDHILLPGHQDLRTLDTKEAVAATLMHIENSPVPVVLCDVAFANGADPLLIDELFKHSGLIKKLWGYAGWNTSGNSFGSALAMGIAGGLLKIKNAPTLH